MKNLLAELARRRSSYDWAAVSWRRFWQSMALNFLDGALKTALAIPLSGLAIHLFARFHLLGW